MATFTQSALSIEEIERFDKMRAELNRLYPRVSHRVGDPVATREQFGRAEQVGVFRFLLVTVPHLGSFADEYLGRGSLYRERFFETRAMASAALQQAMGWIERDITTVEAGPSTIDSLAEQAERAGLSGFLSRLADAETHVENEEFDDAIHSARRAIERLVTEIANAIATTPRRRSFRAAMDTRRDAGLVDDTTHLSIVTQKVGFWGWASEIGTHDEDDPDGGFDAGPPEARLAIERARAIAEYLLSRFAVHVALGENERAEAN